jgi:hypothetical protein
MEVTKFCHSGSRHTALRSTVRSMPTVFERGPYLGAAVLCERAIQEPDGVLTLVRVIDKITGTVIVPQGHDPDQMPPFMVSLTLIIMLRAGEARGNYVVKVRPEAPTGAQLAATELPVSFTGSDDAQGVNLLVNLNFGAQYEGLHWFDVLLDDLLLTRVPLHIEYQPGQEPTPPAPRAPENSE